MLTQLCLRLRQVVIKLLIIVLNHWSATLLPCEEVLIHIVDMVGCKSSLQHLRGTMTHLNIAKTSTAALPPADLGPGWSACHLGDRPQTVHRLRRQNSLFSAGVPLACLEEHGRMQLQAHLQRELAQL
jgi:hypothetical protein